MQGLGARPAGDRGLARADCGSSRPLHRSPHPLARRARRTSCAVVPTEPAVEARPDAEQPQPSQPSGRSTPRVRPARLRPADDPPRATYELRSGAARLVVGTDGSLALFRGDAAAPTLLARAVIPWFVARHGAAVADPSAPEGELELRWGDSARLRVASCLGGGFGWDGALTDGFRIRFCVRPREGRAHPRDMAELAVELESGGEWYGGGHLMRQHWPLNRGAWEVGPHYPFDNGPNGLNTLVGHHWVASGGGLACVDPDTPYLHVGLNSPPPRRNWFLGGLRKISWGVGIQNFTRQILPLGAGERRGDGLLHLQARSSYESRRIDHPLSGWLSPLAAGADGARRLGERVVAAAAAAAARALHAPAAPPAPLHLALAAEGAGAGVAEGGAGAALLHRMAHGADSSVAGQFAASGTPLPLAPAREAPAGGARAGAGAHTCAWDELAVGEGEAAAESEEEWLTLSAVLCAAPDVRAAARMALAGLPRPPQPPLPALLRAPIWTTWARYKSGVTQRDVERFAAEIVARRLPRSVLEIDDRWQAAYGDTAFDSNKFPDPPAMVRRLHALGFRVTLWVMPFVEEGSACYAEGCARGFFVKSRVSAGLGLQPGFFRWWNSSPVVGLDVTNPAACEWFVGRLQALQEETGVDGFKFDAGEPCFLPACFTTHQPLVHPSQYTHLWVTRIASRFDVAEVRTGHQSTQVPLLTRMGDRFSEWGVDNGLGSLIPTLLTSSVLGYPFCLPDMIGGNAYFGRSPSAELMVRWAQASALMPALQFSIAPWDLSAEAEAHVRSALELREGHLERIVQLAQEATRELEPICRPLWWLAPTDAETFAIADQFAVGERLIVAPVVARGALERDVYLPAGLWASGSEPAETHVGPAWLRSYPAPLDALPTFVRID